MEQDSHGHQTSVTQVTLGLLEPTGRWLGKEAEGLPATLLGEPQFSVLWTRQVAERKKESTSSKRELDN